MTEGSGTEASPPTGTLKGKPGGTAPLLGGPEGNIKKGSAMGVYLHRGPIGRPRRDHLGL